MQKQIGSILLVAGTCIGSGMIALPMVMSKLGLVPGTILMMIIWSVMYYTSLISVELNLQAGKGLSLGALGRMFSGLGAEIIGTVSLKLLSYSLLAVFIYGGSSVLQKLLEQEISFTLIASIYAIATMVILLLPIRLLDYINRVLFVGLLIVVTILIAGLASMINWDNLPLTSHTYTEVSVWREVIPVVFTSFGFQVIFHTLTNYCNKDKKVLKTAFFWGSLIPAIIYIVWTSSIIIVVHNENPSFYIEMREGKADVGDLIRELSNIAKWQYVQLLVWWISLLAIITSILGVGVGLCDSLKTTLSEAIPNSQFRNVASSVITVLPAYLVATLVPNAFITILGFAGMILVVIAILLPIYLFYKAKVNNPNYSELKCNLLIWGAVIIGLVIMGCEIVNMLSRQ